VLQLDPNYSGVHRALDIVLEAKGELPPALEHYRHALQLEPNDREAKGEIERIATILSRKN